MQLIIKCLSGRKPTFNFESDNTILQLKEALEEKEGLYPDTYLLSFGGKKLLDEMKIGDYNLEDGSTILMTLNLKGG